MKLNNLNTNIPPNKFNNSKFVLDLKNMKELIITNDLFLSKQIKSSIKKISKIRKCRELQDNDNLNMLEPFNIILEEYKNKLSEIFQVKNNLNINSPLIESHNSLIYDDYETSEKNKKTYNCVLKEHEKIIHSNFTDESENIIQLLPTSHVNSKLIENNQLKSKSKNINYKKIISIFSVKNNDVINNLQIQIIDILDPNKQISERQRSKSFNILLNTKEVNSILCNNISSLESDITYESEDLNTKLSLLYAKHFIEKCCNGRKRTTSGTKVTATSLNKYLNPSFGFVDGCIDIHNKIDSKLSRTTSCNTRESFNALSHMFTLKKLLGFEHIGKPSLIRRKQSNSLISSEEDLLNSSGGNEDSIDETLIKIFSQKLIKEINFKN